jgi:hypothetical protein
MSNLQHRIDTITRYLETNAAPAQDSSSEQLERLLFLGNVLGLYDAVDLVRRRFEEQETPAAKFERLNAACNRASDELSEEYLPRVRALLESGDVEGAKALIKEIPSESVTKAFALDALRQATLKKEP